MSQFENVTVKKEANIYFDGKVTSRTIEFPDGEIKTLGVMQPGEYEFGTDTAELMEITRGSLMLQLAGDEVWTSVQSGDSFNVSAKSRFKVVVAEMTDYVCSDLNDK
ncbi:MAG: pyrimidine/purine nucleoside phosphorylase [Desulfuromonadales bacterium]|nr:pyrimidine/purine nucleoside phosphorylase [Desulfuromonadales bacterium]